uniref:Uncharacterized protein n=1 Tax=Alexandrium catenella TaxID=2925 RepID=A0A7S1WPN6_ALECA
MQELKPWTPKPIPLTEFIRAAKGEGWLLQVLGKSDLCEEHRTAKPWCVMNRHAYLEAPRELDGWTPLHVAAEMDYDRLATKIVADGARVDLQSHHGRTALMVAAEQGHLKTLKALLRLGASHSARDCSGKQALHHAVTTLPSAPEMVKVLAQARADVEARDQRGVTPLMVGAALQASAAVDVLLECGAARLGFDRHARAPLDHAFASSSSRRRPAAVALPRQEQATRAYRRWDNLGEPGVQRSLLFEERTWRRKPVPVLGVDARDRLHAAMPQLA